MRILFVGSVQFSKNALDKLIDLREDIIGIVCKESSKFNSDFYDLGPIANTNNIPYFYTKNINTTETENWIKEKSPDVIYCFGWSQIIKPNILKIPRLGIIGFHPAEVPKNKGRHPIIWALFLGLTQTATTFFFMNEGTDTGDILSQKKIKILSTDNAATLYKKITETALLQIEEFSEQLKRNNFTRRPQKLDEGNYWRKRGNDDGKIDWRMNSVAIYNLVRSLTKPYIGAHINFLDKQYKIWKVKIIEQDKYLSNLEPGKILNIDFKNKTFQVKTYDGVIEVLEHDIDNIDKIGEYI